MKSKITLLTSLFFLLCTVVFYSCRKELITTLSPDQNLSEEARKAAQWYSLQTKGSKQEFTRQNKPEWSKMITDTIQGGTLLALPTYQKNHITREMNINIFDGEYSGAIKEYNTENKDTLTLKVYSLTGRLIEQGYLTVEGKYHRTKVAFGNTVTLMGAETLREVSIIGSRPSFGSPMYAIPAGPKFPIGGGGGTGPGPKDKGKGKNFGIDPNCQNCQIKVNDFEAFLEYAKKAGLTIEISNTTVTLSDGTKFEARVTELYNSNKQLVSTYVNPNVNIKQLTTDLNYSIGNKGPDGTSNPGVTSPSFTSPGGEIFNFTTFPIGGAVTYVSYYSRVLDYIKTNGQTSQYNQEFAKWADQYLKANPKVTFEMFRNRFSGRSEGFDGDFDEAYWNDPNLVIQKQALPSWADFSANFPTHNRPNSVYRDYSELLPAIGGDVGALYVPGGEAVNTCAIRISYALVRSGVTIPDIGGTTINGVYHERQTLKGRDGKFYFIRAKELNAWMRRTFGTNDGDPKTPHNPNHQKITKLQAGTYGANLPTLLAGKKGIYCLVSDNRIWSSGHADLLYDDGTCGVECHFDGPIDWIDVWLLQ